MCLWVFLIEGNKNNLMKFAAVSAKALKTVKCFPKILLNTYIMDLCLSPYFCILFKMQLESAANVFMTELVSANFNNSETIDEQ